MPGLILPSQWTSQPQVAAGVNWANPLARGLAYLNWKDTLLQREKPFTPMSVSGSANIGASVVGLGPSFATSGGNRYSAALSTSVPGTEPFTLEVLCAVTASPSLGGYFALYDAFARGLISFGGGSNRNIYFWGNGNDLASGVDWRVDGNPQHVFVTSEGSGGAMTFYRDGAVIATGTTPAVTTLTNPNFNVGDVGHGWGSSPTGTIGKTAYYRRALSSFEIAALSANPWQIFAPLPRRIIVTAAATPGTLTGDVTTTGWTATPSGDYYATLDEAVASDTDYITSPTLGTGGPITMSIEPVTAGTYDVQIRAAYSGSAGQVRANLLNSSNVSQGVSSWQTLTSSPTTYTLSVTTTGTATRVRIEVQ
jgi:hypothetical protein